MNYFFRLGFLGTGCALAGVVAHAATWNSPVSGVYDVSLPAGTSIFTPGLVRAAVVETSMDALEETSGHTVLTQSGAGWTPGEFAVVGGTPTHYVEIVEGPWEGLVVDVLENGMETLELAGALVTDFDLKGDERYVLRPHNTLQSLFPDGGGLESLVDSVRVFHADGTTGTYLVVRSPESSSWINGAAANSDNVVIYPGEAILFNLSAPTAVTLGAGSSNKVKEGPTRVPLHPGRISLVGMLSPLAGDAVTLRECGFEHVFVPLVDSVRLFADDGSMEARGTFLFYDSGSPETSSFVDGGLRNGDLESVPVGSGAVVTVQSPVFWISPALVLP